MITITRTTSRRRAPTIPPPAADRDCNGAGATDWHRSVKADAASGSPVTRHGQHLLVTARDWKDNPGWSFGECECGSTLAFRLAESRCRQCEDVGVVRVGSGYDDTEVPCDLCSEPADVPDEGPLHWRHRGRR